MNAPLLYMPVSALNFVSLWHRTHARHIEYAVRQLESDISLDANLVGRDDRCRMGQWLRAQTHDIQSLPSFAAVTRVHSEYHRIARELVVAYQAGQAATVDALLEGDFVLASDALMAQIDDLGRDVTRFGCQSQPFLPEEMDSPPSALLTLAFRVGHPDIDRGHALLVNVINDILQAQPQMNGSADDIAEFIETLAACLGACFAAEERLLGRRQTDDARTRAHCQAHGRVLARLKTIQDQAREGTNISLGDLGLFLRDWFTAHFVDYDTDLVGPTS